MNDKIVQLKEVQFRWHAGAEPVLSIDHFSLNTGQRLFLKGPSGSGKTTLLSLIAAVLQPVQGDIVVDNIALNTLKGGQRDQFRVDHIGLIFQQFNLLPFLSVKENIQLPCRFSSQRRANAGKNMQHVNLETDRLLSAMRLDPKVMHNRSVTELSVGQQQRVAVARALIGRPPLIIADEPTSALDSHTRHAFLELLFAECESAGCSLLYVSHDETLAHAFDRCVDLHEINSGSTPDNTWQGIQ